MTWTAGANRATGDVITAAQWNGYLGSAGNITLTAPGVVTTQGDTVYATAANTLARLAKGTGRQSLSMNSGATAPEWVASPASTLTTTGDLLYASGANTIARLAAATDGHVLTATGAGSAPAWEANPAPGSSVPTTTAGDTLYASSSNTLAGLSKGAARTSLTMNSGASAPEWTASPSSLMTTTGDILIASGANTPARLAASTDGYVLTATGAGSAPAWEALAAGPTLVLKTSDQAVDNSTSLVNDSQLVFAMEANSYYLIEIGLFIRSFHTGAMKHFPVVPSGCTWGLGVGPFIDGSYNNAYESWGTNGDYTSTRLIKATGNDKDGQYVAVGWAKTASAAGNFQWQFAQNVATSSQPATMRYGAYIRWEKGA